VKATVAEATNMAPTVVSDVIMCREPGYNAINDVIITFPSRTAPRRPRGILLRASATDPLDVGDF